MDDLMKRFLVRTFPLTFTYFKPRTRIRGFSFLRTALAIIKAIHGI